MNTTSRHKQHWTQSSTDFPLTCEQNGWIKPMKRERRMNVQALTHYASSSQIELGLCALVTASIILRNSMLPPLMHLFLAKRPIRLKNRETEASKLQQRRRRLQRSHQVLNLQPNLPQPRSALKRKKNASSAAKPTTT